MKLELTCVSDNNVRLLIQKSDKGIEIKTSKEANQLYSEMDAQLDVEQIDLLISFLKKLRGHVIKERIIE